MAGPVSVGEVAFVVVGANERWDGEYARAEGEKNDRPVYRRVGRDDATCYFSSGDWLLGGAGFFGCAYWISPPAGASPHTPPPGKAKWTVQSHQGGTGDGRITVSPGSLAQQEAQRATNLLKSLGSCTDHEVEQQRQANQAAKRGAYTTAEVEQQIDANRDADRAPVTDAELAWLATDPGSFLDVIARAVEGEARLRRRLTL